MLSFKRAIIDAQPSQRAVCCWPVLGISTPPGIFICLLLEQTSSLPALWTKTTNHLHKREEEVGQAGSYTHMHEGRNANPAHAYNPKKKIWSFKAT